MPAQAILVLSWRGGVGPYQVQRRTGLAPETWSNVGNPTTSLTATVEWLGASSFFRIVQP